MLKFIIPIALAVLFFAQLAEAQTFYDQREAFQRERIRQGIASGQITRYEARRLWDEQRRIERMESRFEADGRVTPRERAWLDRALDRSGRHIWQESHDRQRVVADGRHRDWRSDHRGWQSDQRGWRGDHHGFPNADARLRNAVSTGSMTPRQAYQVHNRIHGGRR